jgi:hypothetical protein
MKQLIKAELKERGWTDGLIEKLLPEPEIRHRYGGGHYYLWFLRDVANAERTSAFKATREARARRDAKKAAHRDVDLLAAIFTVNRAAKRQRDAAQAYYQNRMHGFAGASKRRKIQFYALKDRGIAAAHQAGRLTCLYRHGGLFLWQGESYSFHSTLKPIGLEVPELPLREGEDFLFVEAKPKGAKEPRLSDAQHTLLRLAPDLGGYEHAPSPERRREAHSVVCWMCGEEGHVSRECLENLDSE